MQNITVFPIDDWPTSRITHARKRLSDLQSEFIKFKESNPLGLERIHAGPGQSARIVVKNDKFGGNYTLSLLIGELANALRGALDATVWQIMKDERATDQVLKRVVFPILKDDSDWERSTTSNWIGTAPLALQDRVRFCQPFERSTGYSTNPLLVLQEISNQDKHRSAASFSITVAPELKVTMEYRDSAPRDTEKKFADWMSKGLRHPNSGPVKGQVLFSGKVPWYVKYVQAECPFEAQGFVQISDTEKINIEELQLVIDYVEQIIWYIAAGEDAQETYLRSPTKWMQEQISNINLPTRQS